MADKTSATSNSWHDKPTVFQYLGISNLLPQITGNVQNKQN